MPICPGATPAALLRGGGTAGTEASEYGAQERADITPKESTRTFRNHMTGETREITSKIILAECRLLLIYYTYGLVDETVRETDFVDWAREYRPQQFEQ